METTDCTRELLHKHHAYSVGKEALRYARYSSPDGRTKHRYLHCPRLRPQQLRRPTMICITCGEDIDPPQRVLLGYKVCLDCGDSTAKKERSTWTIVPTPKGHYTRITRKSDLLALNQKPR